MKIKTILLNVRNALKSNRYNRYRNLCHKYETDGDSHHPSPAISGK